MILRHEEKLAELSKQKAELLALVKKPFL